MAAGEHPQAATTRRQLGEVGVMAHRVEMTERQILRHAETMLGDVEQKLPAARAAALAGSDEQGTAYQHLVAEHGRLTRVIAQARELLKS